MVIVGVIYTKEISKCYKSELLFIVVFIFFQRINLSVSAKYGGSHL